MGQFSCAAREHCCHRCGEEPTLRKILPGEHLQLAAALRELQPPWQRNGDFARPNKDQALGHHLHDHHLAIPYS